MTSKIPDQHPARRTGWRAWAGGLRLVWLALLCLSSVAPTIRADTVVLTTTNQVVLQLALNAGGVVRFNFATTNTFHLTTNLVISTNVTLDGGGRVIFDGGGSYVIVTNTTVNPLTDFTNGIVASTNGTRLIAVNSNAALTLLNLTLINGHATNGGAILNRGTLVVSNCLFAGNVAMGPAGANGGNGSTNLYGSGGNGGNGGNGGGALGGAICNYGSNFIIRSYFATNVAGGGMGGTGGTGGDGYSNAGQGGQGGSGGAAFGGAIYNSGALVLFACELDSNYAYGGAGSAGGVHGSGLCNLYNGVGGAGGAAHGAGIYNTGLLNPFACTLAGNVARGGHSAKGGTNPNNTSGSDGAPGGSSLGGGICNLGTNTMVNCTVVTNRVTGGLGGDGGDGSPNAGQGGAGGNAGGGDIYNSGRTVATNCTFAGGSSQGGFGGQPGSGQFAATIGANGSATGANLAHNSGAFILKNSLLAYPVSRTNSYDTTNTVSLTLTTVTTNWSTYIDPRTGQIITNGISGYTTNTSTVTTNIVTTHDNIAAGLNGSGPFTDAGFNLSSDGSVNFSNNGLINTDPRLEPLMTNGGPTYTMALGLNSPAINRGDTNTGLFLDIDQRGQPRVQGGRADIGAYESPVIGLFNLSGQIVDGAREFAPVSNVLVTFTVWATNSSGQSNFWTFTTLSATNGSYAFTNVPGGNATVTPSRDNYRFTHDGLPSFETTLTTNLSGLDFLAYQTFSISGLVTLDGAGLAGMTVDAEGFSADTDATGYYIITNLDVFAAASSQPIQYTVAPLVDGYSFSPASTNVTASTNSVTITNINFTVAGSRSISGYVTNAANQGVAGVVVVVGSDFAVTDTNGFYSLSGLLPDIYTVIPFASDISLTPSSTDVDLTLSDATASFFALTTLLNISGRVVNSLTGAGVRDVAITTTASGGTSTDPYGYFSLLGVANDSQVVPSLRGYSFAPAVTNLASEADPAHLNFTAFPLLSISGNLTEGTNGVPGFIVTALGANLVNTTVTNALSTITDMNGAFSFTNLDLGDYTVTSPTNGVGFNLANRSVPLALWATNVQGISFTANPPRLRLLRTNQAGPFQLTVTALTNRSYKVQTKTSLATNILWQNITNAITVTTNTIDTTNVVTTNYVVTKATDPNGVFTLPVTNNAVLRFLRAIAP